MKHQFPLADMTTGIEGVTYGQFVKSLFRPLPPALMFTHAALGLATEADEAFNATGATNFLEELGDYAFFLTALYQSMPAECLEDMSSEEVHAGLAKVHIPDFFPNGSDGVVARRAIVAGWLTPALDAAKRWVAYDKAPDKATCLNVLTHAVLAMSLLTTDWAEASDQSPQTIVNANVAKLRHRYKGGFSVAAAVNRDLQGEMNAVESVQKA